MTYPAALTDKAWQKNKGLFAKGKPTGIGEALTAMQKEYIGSGFAVDPKAMGAEVIDPLAFDQRLTAYGKTLEAHAKKIDARGTEVLKRISEAEKTFAKDKSVLKVLADLRREVGSFTTSLAPSGTVVKSLKTAIAASYATALKSNGAYLVMIGNKQADTNEKARQTLISELRELWDEPTRAKMHAMWNKDGEARLLRTTPVLWDKTLAKSFPQATASLIKGSAFQKYNQDLHWIDIVGNEQGGSATNAVTEMMKTMDEKTAVQKFTKEYLANLKDYTQFTFALGQLERMILKHTRS